ncbi:hypothetical protein HDK77DRAFT_486552 [Phyllosticta capitalensis]
MSQQDLQPRGLYILLFARGDNADAKDDFHWALYLHQDKSNGGRKFHITGSAGKWLAEHGVTKAVLKEFLIVGLIQIANVPEGLEDHIDKKCRSLDSTLNQEGITCRTWLFKVLKLLQAPVDGKIPFPCADLDALEREVKDWGNANLKSAIDNVQPRPVAVSRFCSSDSSV